MKDTCGHLPEWRLLEDPPLPGTFNMARDLALLRSVSNGAGPPTLRLYGWDPPAITIGYFQRPEDELNLEECGRDGVMVIRRITGGGAVYHHHEITYSVVIPLRGTFGKTSITESYERLCTPLIKAFRTYGIDAAFKPVNDILAGGKKLSGSAQTRRDGVLLQHGTILFDVDPERMFRYLKIPEQKKHSVGEHTSDRVTSLKTLLGGDVMTDDFRNEFNRILTGFFESELGVCFKKGTVMEDEERERKRIENGLFSRDAWNLYRTNELDGGAGE